MIKNENDTSELERTSLDDNVVNHIPNATAVLGKTSITNPVDAAKSVVDTPTSLAAGTNFNIGFLLVLAVGVVFFLVFRRKKNG